MSQQNRSMNRSRRDNYESSASRNKYESNRLSTRSRDDDHHFGNNNKSKRNSRSRTPTRNSVRSFSHRNDKDVDRSQQRKAPPRLDSGSKLRMDDRNETNRARKDSRNQEKNHKESKASDRRPHREREDLIDSNKTERWDHSGFKELYNDDLNKRAMAKERYRGDRSKSRSWSPDRKMQKTRNYQTPTGAIKKGKKSDDHGHYDKESFSPGFKNNNKRESSGGREKYNGKELNKRNKDRKRRSSSFSNSSRTPSPQNKKSLKADHKEKREVPKSESYSSGTSSDEDVLEIHAEDRKRDSFSESSDDSLSDISGRKSMSGDSTDSSTSSSNSKSDQSESDESDGEKPKKKAGSESKNISSKSTSKNNNNKGVERGKEKQAKKSETNKKETKSKRISKLVATTLKNTTAEKSSKSSTSKKEAASESDSDSLSDSDDEPRMTLSERFAKLTQTSTDKREFAKSEISINEIDTKLKVIKDLRSSQTRVLSASNHPRSSSSRNRPKSPEYNGGLKYSTDDRRKYFEEMTRDEPRERPNDWSDVAVRYNYYKSRGYFNDRPLSLDEFSKWEDWWFKYRDWLANEGYYDQMKSPANGQRSWVSPSRSYGRDGFNNQRPIAPPRTQPMPLMAHPIMEPRDMRRDFNYVPISRRVGPSGHMGPNGPHPQSRPNFMRGGGRGRLAGRIGMRH